MLLKASPVLISLPTVSRSMHREPEQVPEHNKAISITHYVLPAGWTPGIKAFDNKCKVFNVFLTLFSIVVCNGGMFLSHTPRSGATARD